MTKRIFSRHKRTAGTAARLALLALIAALASGCPAGSEPGDPNNPETPTNPYTDDEFAATLYDLGVEPSLTAPVDPSGNPLPSGYNPLRAAPLGATDNTGPSASASARAVGDGVGGRVSFHPLYEIYLGGVDHTNDGTGRKSILYNDLKGGWPSSDIAQFPVLQSDQTGQAWLNAPKKAIGADFDGDGYDEVLIAVVYREAGQIALRLGKGGSTEFSRELTRFTYPGDLAAELPENNYNSNSGSAWGSETEFLGLDLATGDFDADGKAEAILVVAGYVFLVDNLEAGSGATTTLLRSYDVSDRPSDVWRFVSVAAADYDQDGYDDWVEAVATASDTAANIKTATYQIYSGQTRAAFNTLYSYGDVKIPGNSKAIRSVNVATGDFDGDGLPETAFCGRKAEAGEYRLYILDTAMDADSKPVFGFLDTIVEPGWKGGSTPQWGSLIPPLVTGDMNGNGRDEIFAVSTVYGLDSSGLTALYVQENPGHSPPGNNTMYDLAVMGDINGDLKADIIYYGWQGWVECVTVDDSGVYHYMELTGRSYPQAANRERGMAIALANIDDDSYILQYQSHELLYTEPVVVAVLASSPYYGDITYPTPIDHHHTTYGETESTGDRTKYSHSLELTASLSFGEGALKISAAGGTTWGFASAREVTSTMSYSAGAGEDKVVFTSIPYDVYSYKVLSAPAGNTDGDDGAEVQADDILHFDYPRPLGTYSQSLTYYNAHNGDFPDVTVPHTIGQPFTYTKYSEMVSLKAKNGGKGLYTTASDMVVGVGDTGWTFQSVETVTAAEKDFEWNVGLAVGALQFLGTGVSTSLRTSIGYRYRNTVTTRVTSGLFIEGEVPNIPNAIGAEDPDHPLFRWGLLMYPFESSAAGEEQAFNYVTYWVDEDK